MVIFYIFETVDEEEEEGEEEEWEEEEWEEEGEGDL